MHHFIYPTQDTFITNTQGLDSLNFGLDEILQVGTQGVSSQVVSPTTSVGFTSSVSNFCIFNFSGLLNAEIYGTASFAFGTIFGASNVTSSYYSGTLTGSYLSASNISSSNFTGSLTKFTGSFGGLSNGIISGSLLTEHIQNFSGSVSSFTGKIISGYAEGTQILNQQNVSIQTSIYINRALFQFDLTAISESISTGGIVNPSFILKIKTARAQDLPIQYSIYAFPLVESWVMGNGYLSDGGSVYGSSWTYRDFQGGTPWASSGGTYTTQFAGTQSFNYQSSDISIDVSNMVNGWISGEIENNGMIIVSGEEMNPLTTGMNLYFFSEDTNTIYSPYLDAGWDNSTIVTGSLSTGSVIISTVPPGLFATASDSPSIFNSSISGSIFGIMDIINIGTGSISGSVFITGSISGQGQTGNIIGVPIFGGVSGSIITEMEIITQLFPGLGPTFETNDFDFNTFIANYGYFPFVTTTNVVTTAVTFSVLTATLVNGDFSGSYITAPITNTVQFQGGITGSWNPQIFSGSTYLSASYPFLNPPSLIVTITGDFLSGTGFGSALQLTSNNGSEYGIFSGSMVSGPFIGSKVILPFTGSLSTASYSYTSSISMISSSLNPLEVSSPFIIVVKIPEKVKTNEIIKVKVFGREQYPLKNFQRLTQFSQFLTPLYLPYSSFYAIKDNETEEIILDFDNYTRLSCDTNGSYFMLDTTGLPQERYFKILIRVEQSGSIYVLDNDDIFKVVR